VGIPDLLVVIALVFAAVAQWDAKGRGLIAWAVMLLCVAMLWHLLPL
jgi:hypothetical protein